jgi:nicotinate-nucleotide adenylyltransferase
VSVGVFGGAFDPPHVGHVELARRGIEHFGLGRLLVRVVEDPGHKDVRTPPDVRLHLAELAFGTLTGVDVELDPCARTVDSLVALGLDDPVFLVGADEFAAFLSWKQPQRVLELARLGVATRPGIDRGRLDAVLARLEQPERVSFFEIEPLPVSSSDIRARSAAGEPIDGLVPAAVAAEVARLELYRAR